MRLLEEQSRSEGGAVSGSWEGAGRDRGDRGDGGDWMNKGNWDSMIDTLPFKLNLRGGMAN